MAEAVYVHLPEPCTSQQWMESTSKRVVSLYRFAIGGWEDKIQFAGWAFEFPRFESGHQFGWSIELPQTRFGLGRIKPPPLSELLPLQPCPCEGFPDPYFTSFQINGPPLECQQFIMPGTSDDGSEHKGSMEVILSHSNEPADLIG